MTAGLTLGAQIALLVTLIAAAGCFDNCPTGEKSITIGGESYCGQPCPTGCGSCPTGQVCKESFGDPLVCVATTSLAENGESTSCNADTTPDPIDPTCEPEQVRTNVDGRIYCLDQCASDADCSTCCVPQTTGYSLCAPSPSYCDGTPSTDGGTSTRCEDRTGCLSLEWRESGCLYYTPTNTCGEDIAIKVCAERGDGEWSCGQWTLSPYSTEFEQIGTCNDPTGRYQFAAVVPPPTGCFGFP